MIKRINNRAVSLVEVVVASVIFLIASAGAFGAFSIAQKKSAVSEKEIVAANYGRQLLENLRSRVDGRTWSSGWYLTCDGAAHQWPENPAPADAFQGTTEYTCDEDASGIRKVTLKMNW